MFSGFLPLILMGLAYTVLISVLSLLLGLCVSILMAAGEGSSVKWLSAGTFAITGVLRGLPEIVVLFTCYFGGTILLTNLFGHYTGMNALFAGVLSLGLIFAAYAAQVLRGAYLQVPVGQKEAGYATGLTQRQVLIKITLPQLLEHAKPGLSNLWLSLLKDSSLVSLISLPEMMNNVNLAVSQTHSPFLFYSLAAILYLLLTSASKRLFDWRASWT